MAFGIRDVLDGLALRMAQHAEPLQTIVAGVGVAIDAQPRERFQTAHESSIAKQRIEDALLHPVHISRRGAARLPRAIDNRWPACVFPRRMRLLQRCTTPLPRARWAAGKSMLLSRQRRIVWPLICRRLSHQPPCFCPPACQRAFGKLFEALVELLIVLPVAVQVPILVW